MCPRSNAAAKLALALLIAATLGGCAGEYLDRRDTVALSSGNAIASDQVTQMVDPWPRDSANRDIAFNGAKMESAVERYRTNQVIAPKGTGTSATYGQQQAPANNTPVGPSIGQPAPVK